MNELSDFQKQSAKTLFKAIGDSSRLRGIIEEVCPHLRDKLPPAPATLDLIADKAVEQISLQDLYFILLRLSPIISEHKNSIVDTLLNDEISQYSIMSNQLGHTQSDLKSIITKRIFELCLYVICLTIFNILMVNSSSDYNANIVWLIMITINAGYVCIFSILYKTVRKLQKKEIETHENEKSNKKIIEIHKEVESIVVNFISTYDKLNPKINDLVQNFISTIDPTPGHIALRGQAGEIDLPYLRDLIADAKDKSIWFAYEGDLPAHIANELDLLRLQGHPIIPLSQKIMASAIAEGNSQQVWAELQRRYSATSNLFLLSSSLIDQQMFFGRIPLIDTLSQSLKQRNSLYITGLRKSGKSSFLNILRQQHPDGPWVHLDMQAVELTDPNWPEDLFRETLKKMDIWGKSVWADWHIETIDLLTTSHFRQHVLKRLEQAKIRGRILPLVVVLDEVERLLPRGSTDCSAYLRFTGVLRALAQEEGHPLCLLVADLRPSLNRNNLLYDGQLNPFYLFFQEHPMPPLTIQEVGQMVRRLSFGMGVPTVDQDFIDYLYQLSGGHAFLSRHMAGYCCEQRATPDRLQRSDMERGQRFMDDRDFIGNFCAQNIWAMLEKEEQEALLFVVLGQGTPTKQGMAGLRAMGILNENAIHMQVLKEWVQEQAPRLIMAKPLPSLAMIA